MAGRAGDQLKPRIILRPKQVAKALALTVAVLVLCHFATRVAKFEAGHTRLLGLVQEFDLGNENNIATWYSSMTLSLCAMLLAVIGLHKKDIRDAYARHWLGLSGIFLLLALDETASLHERANHLGRYFKQFDYFGGYLFHPWVAVGICFVLAIGTVYLKFLTHLPKKTKRQFLVAGSLYVLGALGLEMIEGRVAFLLGVYENLLYQSLVGVEEALEMIGVVVFIHALLSYIDVSMSGFQVDVVGTKELSDESSPQT
jgi:hypothetical protein